MCCGEAPTPISGHRRCIWSSWRLQTAHTSDHCDLWRCALLAQGQAADKLSTCKQHSRQKDTFYTAQRGRNCCYASVPRVAGALFTAKHTTMTESSTSAAYLAMPPHADDYRQTCRIVAKLPRSADITRPAQTEMIPLRVGSHERTQNTGQFIPRAETCKQRLCDVVLVFLTYG